MNTLRRFWNWLLGKTTIDEKIVETYNEVREEVEEKIEDVKEYVNNVESELQDVVSALKGKVTKSKLRSLTKSQLIDEAKNVFGVELNSKDNKTTLINKVYNLHHKK